MEYRTLLENIMTNLPNFWSDDHLKRKDEATYLTRYLAARYIAKKNEEGFVLAINGDWGLGKSFLIERWSKELEFNGHPVVMFNSWENDFTPEPLIAFVSELNSALEIQFKTLPAVDKLREAWLTKAKAVLVPTLKVVGLAALKRGAGFGIDEITAIYNRDDAGEGASKNKNSEFNTKEISEKLSKVIEDELKSHSNVKIAIKDFKSRLGTLVKHLDSIGETQLPIFVFIDELDRCRPDYAIKLLEGIKHLFGIPGIHFIVATNLSELAHSVRAIYGEQFSAERYLKRFFDMEYSLPEPEGLEFAAELMIPIAELPGVQFITGLDQILRPNEFPGKNLSFIFVRYAVSFGLRLRDQQQMAKLLEASILTLGSAPIHIHFLLFLVGLYQKSSQLYHDLVKLPSVSGNAKFINAVPDFRLSPFIFPDNLNENNARRVSIADVADVYLTFISGSLSTVSRPHDFPGVLLLNVRTTHDQARFATYVNAVRRAGQFLK